MFSKGGQYLLSSKSIFFNLTPNSFLDEKSTIFVYDSILFSQIYKFEQHDSRINNLILIHDRYVISNCTRGRIFFWEIEDRSRSNKKMEISNDDEIDLYRETFGHEHTKPYSSFAYDSKRDLFVACLPEK